MLNKLIEQIYTQIVKHRYKYFRRGSCKGCLFANLDKELLTKGQCYCIFNPEPKIVDLKYKCGRIVKR